MTLDWLHLAPTMHDCAAALQAAHPTVTYLSGRRDLEAQAHAMACNVVTDRQFIYRTYKHAAVLQSAVDLHPEAKTVAQLTDVLHDALLALNSVELAQVSDHLTGDAVDLLPMEDADGHLTPEGQAVVGWIHSCASTTWFTTREAGLVRWHWSVKASVASSAASVEV